LLEATASRFRHQFLHLSTPQRISNAFFCENKEADGFGVRAAAAAVGHFACREQHVGASGTDCLR